MRFFYFLRIASCILLILGTIIGAGFASGKEIYTFFYAYGKNGIIGIIIASIIIGYVIYKTLKITKKYNINDYTKLLEIIVKKEGKIINYKIIINAIVNIFLLITFFVMCAGFVAYFKQEFCIKEIYSSIAISLFCYIVLNKDIKGIILLSSAIMPIIIILLLILAINNEATTITVESTTNYINVIYKGILYASYNSITLTSILIPMKKYIKNKRDILKISISCVIIIFVLAIIIYFILNNIEGNIGIIEMPAVYAAGKINIVFKYLYGIVILGAILTTAISSAFSFLNNISKSEEKYKKYNRLICILTIFISNIGFSTLVNNIYPVFGILGLIQLILIVKC